MDIRVSPEYRWPAEPPRGYVYVSERALRKVARIATPEVRVKLLRLIRDGKEAR